MTPAEYRRMSWDWIKDMPTTPVRAFVSLLLAVFYVIVVLVGALTASHIDMSAVNTVGIFIGTMMGLDVTGFGIKRVTDSGYAAAKTSPVTVNAAAPASSTSVETTQKTTSTIVEDKG